MFFHIGKSGSGKTHFIFKHIKENHSEYKKFFVILPEQSSVNMQEDFFKFLKSDIITNVNFLGFNHFIDIILELIDNKDYVSDIIKLILIKKIIDDNDYKYFSKYFNKKQLLDIIDLLDNSIHNDYYTNDEILSKITDNNFKEKLKEVFDIYSKYTDLLDNKYKTIKINDKLFLNKYKKINTDNIYIYIDGFLEFNARQISIITELIKYTKNLHIFFTFDERKIFNTVKTTFLKLKNIADNNRIEVNILNYNNSYVKKESDLEFLNSKIFSDNNSKCISNNIKLYKAKNIYDEISELIVKIKEFDFKDTAIILTNEEEYLYILENKFKEYHIPYFIDKKYCLNQNLIIKYILLSLRIIENNFKIEDIITFSKIHFYNYSSEDLSMFFDYIKINKISSKKEYMLDFIKNYKNVFTEYDLKIINNIRNNLITHLEDLFLLSNKTITYNEICIILSNYINKLDIINYYINYFENTKNNTELEICLNIYKYLSELLESIMIYYNNLEIDDVIFSELLETLIDYIDVKIIPPSKDEILIGNIYRTKLTNIKHLFIIGASDEFLPTINNNNIFSDSEKEFLKQYNVNIGFTNLEQIDKEPLLLYTHISKVSSTLNISFVKSNISSESYFVDEIKKHLINIKKKKSVFNKLINYSSDYYETKFSNLYKINQFNYNTFISNNSFNYELFAIYENTYKNIFDLLIKSEYVIKNRLNTKLINIYYDKIYIGPTRIEKFYRCPLEYFLDYSIKIKDIEEFKINRLDYGNILHNSLENIIKEISKNISNPKDYENIDKSLISELSKKYLNKSLEEYKDVIEYNNTNKYIKYKLEKILTLNQIVLYKIFSLGEFLPVAFENKIEKDIYTTNIKAIVSSKVDRLDKTKNGLIKIIDYKTGDKKFSLSDVIYGISIQLFMYYYLLEGTDITNFAGLFYNYVKNMSIISNNNNIEKIYKDYQSGIARKETIEYIDNNKIIFDQYSYRKQIDNEFLEFIMNIIDFNILRAIDEIYFYGNIEKSYASVNETTPTIDEYYKFNKMCDNYNKKENIIILKKIEKKEDILYEFNQLKNIDNRFNTTEFLNKMEENDENEK